MKKILIVDDNKEIRHLVSTTLGIDEHSVFEADSGEAAILSAKKIHPDLIIMDIVMSGEVDGIEAIKRIKQDAHTKNIPVIILSGSPIDRNNELGSMGACGFLIKPFSPLDLLDIVDKILHPRLH